MEEQSISIINRTNGQLTGENAQALPIKLITGKWYKFFILGFLFAIVLLVVFVSIIKRQVVVVEVSGKADTYQEYTIN
jgi:hypothetical protein